MTIPSSDTRSLAALTLITVYRKLNLKRLKSKSRFIFGQAKSQSRYSSFDFCPKLVLQTAKYLKGSCITNPFYITKVFFLTKTTIKCLETAQLVLQESFGFYEYIFYILHLLYWNKGRKQSKSKYVLSLLN